MVKATMPFILNTVRNIFVRLIGFVEEVVAPQKKFFFLDLDSVKIHLAESSKSDL